VAIVDDFEEIPTLLAGERGKAPVVEDEQVDPRQHLEEPRIASVGRNENRWLRRKKSWRNGSPGTKVLRLAKETVLRRIR
jgi:hypothetical protein